MSSNAQLFSSKDQSACYADFRPAYPPSLFTAIWDYARLSDYDLALDIATGTGQAIPPLAAKFRRVIGLDGSESQLQGAVPLPNVEYRVADAHATGLPDQSVDLVTTAQAMHWFELPAYYKEVRRVLRPHGCLAVWTYDMGCINTPGCAADKVLRALFERLPWAPGAYLVEQKYAGLEPSQEHFEDTTRQEFCMEMVMKVEPQLMGFLGSWSGIATYRKQHPEGPDPLPQFKADLMAELGTEDEGAEVTIVRTLTLLMARQPVQ